MYVKTGVPQCYLHLPSIGLNMFGLLRENAATWLAGYISRSLTQISMCNPEQLALSCPLARTSITAPDREQISCCSQVLEYVSNLSLEEQVTGINKKLEVSLLEFFKWLSRRRTNMLSSKMITTPVHRLCEVLQLSRAHFNKILDTTYGQVLSFSGRKAAMFFQFWTTTLLKKGSSKKEYCAMASAGPRPGA